MHNSRKRLSLGMATLIVAATFAGCSTNEGSKEVKQSVKKEVYANPEVNTPSDAVQLLKDGNERFVSGKLANFDLGKERLAELSESQKPFAVVVACSDSRVAPEHVFDQGLGELFVVRVAGNVLDHNEIASIEYAVSNLKTPLVMVLGHESCGAVSATASTISDSSGDATEHLSYLMNKIKPAVIEANEQGLSSEEETLNEAIELNVENGIDQLKNESTVISESLDSGALEVIPAIYDLSSGVVKFKDK